MPAEDGQTCEEGSVGVKRNAPNIKISKPERGAAQTRRDKKKSGNEEQPFGTAQQEESKRAPAVAIGAQMRTVGFASIAVKSDRDF